MFALEMTVALACSPIFSRVLGRILSDEFDAEEISCMHCDANLEEVSMFGEMMVEIIGCVLARTMMMIAGRSSVVVFESIARVGLLSLMALCGEIYILCKAYIC